MKHRSPTVPAWPRLFVIALLTLLPLCAAVAQTGAWHPARAIERRPRVLINGDEIALLQARLDSGTYRTIYNAVFRDAFASVPADNTTSNGRRARATLAKNAVFVLLVDRGPAGPFFTTLSPGDRASLVATVERIFTECNTSVNAITIADPSAYDDWQWRTKDMIDLLAAYDMAQTAGISRTVLDTARRRLQQYAGNLYRESTRSILGFTFFGLVKNNHALMTAGALGVAAVTLNDATSTDEAEQPERWIAAALWNMDNVLWRDGGRQSNPDSLAGYAEGPHYFRYAFLNLLPLIRSLRHFLPDTTLALTFNGTTRQIRHPWYDPSFTLLYEWASRIRTPDGLQPPIDDSFTGEAFPELALAGNPRYNTAIAGGDSKLAAQLNSTVDMRANYLACGTDSEQWNDSAMQALPAAGDLVFRSSWGPNAAYMHITAEHGNARTAGAGHNQADETSFMIQLGNQALALDPGYLKYDRRAEVGNAANHNMILVDGSGPAIGTPGIPGGADAYISNAVDFASLDYALATTAYSGASFARHAFFIDNRYFVLADLVTATAPHRYTWQLHGNGISGGDTINGRCTAALDHGAATWSRGNATLLAQVTSRAGAARFDTVAGRHELTYDSAAPHTALTVETSGRSASEFVAVLAPATAGDALPDIVSRPTPEAAVISTDNGFNLFIAQADTADIQIPDTISHIAGKIYTDAAVTYLGRDTTGNVLRATIVDGTHVAAMGYGTILTTERGTLVLEDDGTRFIRGYYSRAGQIIVPSMRFITNVQGDAVEQWTYGPGLGAMTISVSGAGWFVAESGEIGDTPAKHPTGVRGSIGQLTEANNELRVEYSADGGSAARLIVYNALGEQAASAELDPAGSIAGLGIAQLASGVYLVTLQIDGTAAAHRKLLIAR